MDANQRYQIRNHATAIINKRKEIVIPACEWIPECYSLEYYRCEAQTIFGSYVGIQNFVFAEYNKEVVSKKSEGEMSATEEINCILFLFIYFLNWVI
jgi:hypothetical protein